MLLLLVGCAMKRSWDFDAGPTTVAPLTAEVVRARIHQKDAALDVALRNDSSAEKTVSLDSARLELPDGVGWVAVVADGHGVDHPFLVFGKQRGGEQVTIPAGDSAVIQVRAHQYGRDLRRQEHLNVALELRVDGLPIYVPLRLVPPEQAPLGEHI